MGSARTVVLGGGFGGLAVATELRKRVPDEHEIVVIDRRDSFFMGLRKLWLLVGLDTVDKGRRSLEGLNARGIRFVREEITRIDPTGHIVETDQGSWEWDRLVVSLGAEPRPEWVPGLVEHAFNLFDVESVARAAPAVAALQAGRVLVPITGLPYKCPPAPYEAVMLLDAHFRQRGVRDRVNLTFTTLQPALLPNAGAAGAERIRGEFSRRGIDYHVGRKVQRVEEGRIIYEDGEDPFDLCLATPAHGTPQVVRESGLTGDGEWVKVNPRTLETDYPGVFAIGDVTHIPLANGLPLPKAGLFAEAHGKRVAHAIAAQVADGAPARPFDGRGYCFMEMGNGVATIVEADFYAEPEPAVEVKETSAEHLETKKTFESQRLHAWFGG